MPEKPILHGRDHRPGGADPIAGFFDLPWGYCRVDISSLASGTVTQVDFNPTGSAVGYTSGDSSITFGDNGTGRYSLIIEETGLYLMMLGASFSVVGSPAAGSCGAFTASTWLPGSQVSGLTASLFLLVSGATPHTADIGVTSVYNADGTHQTVPHAGNTEVVQNSGITGGVDVWQFAVKLSNTTVANSM